MKNDKGGLLCALILVSALGPWPSRAGEPEHTVSGAVYRGNEPDQGLSDLWLTTLSKQPTLRVLDRQEMRAILGELSLAGVENDSTRQVRLGRLLGVEYFAWIRASDAQVLMEVVEAATGRGLASVAMPYPRGQLPETLPKLAEKAMQSLQKRMVTPTQGMPSIAFSNPRMSATNPPLQAAIEMIMTQMGDALRKAGVTVLSRRFAADAVRERWNQEKGLVEDVAGGQDFQGADYVLNTAVESGNRLALVMIETATGRRLGKREMTIEEAGSAEGTKALTDWGLDRLRPVIAASSTASSAPTTNTTSYAAPEILKSLYTGMLLHNQGRYLDAACAFEEAKARHATKDETDAWIDDCYRLAGFPEIAEEAENDAAPYIKNKAPQKGLSLETQSGQGIALLGLTVETNIARGLAERTSMLVIDSLHKASGSPVLTPDDIADLRNEYDLLLGLEKVTGTTWQKAPSMLVRKAVTAHLESDKAGIRLRLCLIRNSSPTSVCDVVTVLSGNQATWPRVIDDGARELLARNDRGSPQWVPPQPSISESQEQILTELEKSFNPWLYLKALSRDPGLTKYRAKMPWNERGLKRWFVRTLPKQHPDRPLMELRMATALQRWYRDRWSTPSNYQKMKSECRIFADRYPRDVAGLYARYNLLMMDMMPTNLVETETGINDLLRQFEPLADMHTNISEAVDCLRKVDAILRFALGMPGVTREVAKGHWRFAFWTLGLNQVGQENFRTGLSLVITWHCPDTPEQMRMDLSAFCFQQRYQHIPARLFRDIIEKSGTHSDIAEYFCVKYVGLMDRGSTVEDFGVVCPAYAEIICNVLSNGASTLKDERITAEFLEEQISWWPKNPACDAARQVIRLAMEKAFPDLGCQPQTFYEESWRLGPFKHHAWLKGSGHKDSAQAIMEHYYPYLNRLHTLFDSEMKTMAVCRLYCQFGTAFVRAGRYDLAEPLFEQLVSWRDYKQRPPGGQAYVQSLYLLALLKQGKGDTPEALRLAKEAVDYMDAHGLDLPLLSSFGYMPPEADGPSSGTTDGKESGPLLKARVTSFIKDLRENPKLPFKNPYR